MSEPIKLYYQGMREALLDLDKKGQLSALKRVQNRLDTAKAELDAREDFKRLTAASNTLEQIKAFDALSQEAKNLCEFYSMEKKEVASLSFFLYAHSKYEEVRQEMQGVVDDFIAEHFSEERLSDPVEEIDLYHDLLYLSTFGGEMTEERPNICDLAYEFNVCNGDKYKPAIPWKRMRTLFESGLTKEYCNKTIENNLTDIGAAVLVRLNERFGPPAAAKCFTQKVSTGPVQP